MVFVEKQNRNKKIYYYLTKSIRINSKKTIKIRTYLGSYQKELREDELQKLKQEHLLDLVEKEMEVVRFFDTDFKISHFFLKNIQPIFSNSEINVYKRLQNKFQKLKQNKDFFIKKEEEFIISHSYDSTKAEGSTLTFDEVNQFLRYGFIKKNTYQRELNEVANISNVYNFIKEYNGDFDVKFICEIHRLVSMDTLKDSKFEGKLRPKGINVSMGKSEFKCVPGGKMIKESLTILIREFKKYYKKDKFSSIIKFYSAFIAIHPFIDGNGRTSRIILNYLFLKEKLPPINFDSKQHHIIHIPNLSRSILGEHQNLGKYILENLIKSNFFK